MVGLAVGAVCVLMQIYRSCDLFALFVRTSNEDKGSSRGTAPSQFLLLIKQLMQLPVHVSSGC